MIYGEHPSREDIGFSLSTCSDFMAQGAVEMADPDVVS